MRNGQPVTGGWGMRSLCFASEPCREYVLEKLCGVVDRFGVDWLKTDFDLITTSDSPTHSPQATDSRIESVEGYYSILERLHERRPKLYLDNWTPPMGGADFGNFARHHSMLLCDDYHPTAVRSATHGMTHLFPPTRTHGYIRGFSRADERASYTNRSAAFGGGLYLISDILQWDDSTIAATKREIELFKRDRDHFLDGEIHNLFPGKQPDHYGWEGRFVWSPAQGRGMAQVFRNHDPREKVRVRLRGLPPRGRYVVESLEAGTTLRADGRSLVEEGVDVPLATPFTTEVLHVRTE
jgi:alpha-galactosidase